MDEERGAAPTSPEPPDHGGSSSTTNITTTTTTTSNTTTSTNTTTTEAPHTNHQRTTETSDRFTDIKACPSEDVVLTYTEPLIVRCNGPQRILCQDGDTLILPHTDISTPARLSHVSKQTHPPTSTVTCEQTNTPTRYNCYM
ncbi:hypothetical protein NL108_008365 [Boleophthalmus pectinirostris]|nr:hypothetical protein NL108_008365 [Boleophthalmus pectinirostris]